MRIHAVWTNVTFNYHEPDGTGTLLPVEDDATPDDPYLFLKDPATGSRMRVAVCTRPAYSEVSRDSRPLISCANRVEIIT